MDGTGDIASWRCPRASVYRATPESAPSCSRSSAHSQRESVLLSRNDLPGERQHQVVAAVPVGGEAVRQERRDACRITYTL